MRDGEVKSGRRERQNKGDLESGPPPQDMGI